MHNITIVIKTFNRPKTCLNNIYNWNKLYPNINIIIIDDGNEHIPKELLTKNIQYIRTQFDIGASYGRNLGLSMVDTPYALLSDDDDLIDHRSNISQSINYIEFYNLDLLGVTPFSINIDKNNKHITMKKLNDTELTACNATKNFFICKNPQQMCLWDNNIKIGLEHLDYFLTCQQLNKKIASSNLLKFRTEKLFDSDIDKNLYSKYRCRKNIYKDYFIKKWNIQTVKTPWGDCII